MQNANFLKKIENNNAINQAIDLNIDQKTFEEMQNTPPKVPAEA